MLLEFFVEDGVGSGLFTSLGTSAADREGEAELELDTRDGHSLPGELLPARLTMGGIELVLGPGREGGANALRCDGQEIELPPGHHRLWLLAASTGATLEVSLSVDNQERRLRVAPWTGWLSERQRPRRWLGLVPPRAGYLTRDELAWVGTHRHRLGRGAGVGRVEDEPYVFCYLFRYAIDLAPGASRLRLPTNGSLRLFAATLSDAGEQRSRPARPLYG